MADTIPWTQIKALSFDIYGTLIDWENGIASAARATALGPFLPQDHKTLLSAIERLDTRIQRDKPSALQSEIIADGLKAYAEELNVVRDGHLTQNQVDRAAEEYGSKIGSYQAFPDTVQAIRTLGKRYKLIPLSNVDHASFQTTLDGPLRTCHFDAIYTAQDIGSYKPDIRNFNYLLEHVKSDFDIEQNQLCHVAQSLFHDHTPAKTLGLQSVWVDRRGVMGAQTTSGEDDVQERFGFQLRVQSLGELAEIVESSFPDAGR